MLPNSVSYKIIVISVLPKYVVVNFTVVVIVVVVKLTVAFNLIFCRNVVRSRYHHQRAKYQ